MADFGFGFGFGFGYAPSESAGLLGVVRPCLRLVLKQLNSPLLSFYEGFPSPSRVIVFANPISKASRWPPKQALVDLWSALGQGKAERVLEVTGDLTSERSF